MRNLRDRETQNIFELKINKMLTEKLSFEPFPEIPLPNPSQVFQGSSRRIPATPLHSG
jgi:hypothetical protein